MSFRNLFNKNIECLDKLQDNLIYLYPKRNIYIGKNILVPNNYVAVVVFKDRVTDVIQAGKYLINENVFFKTFSLINSRRMKRNGAIRNVKKFRADIYYISLKEKNTFEFQSEIPFVFKTEKFGKVCGFTNGVCNIRLFQPDIVLDELLDIYAYFKNGEFEKEIGYIIGNNINKQLEKSGIDFMQVIENIDSVCDFINSKMEMAFDNLGFRVSNIQIQSLSLPDKKQLKINEYIAESNKNKKAFDLKTLTQDKTFKSYRQVDNVNNTKISMLLDKTIRCEYCGTEIDAIFKTCPICGKNLGEQNKKE